MKVLITGVSGKVGRLMARKLIMDGHTVIGLDRRPWPDAPRGLEMHPADIRKRTAEEVFRSSLPDAVIHMATVTHFANRRQEERSRVNLQGTRKIFEYCHKYGVKNVIFVGRHTYYGVGADSPLYHVESEPPMAVASFPELADLVAADLFAGAALWRFPEMKTCVLRICYTLGPTRHGTLASFLKGHRIPRVMGFDPLYQLMHEEDAVRALEFALDAGLRGVFNVCGSPPVPLSVLVKATGRVDWPLPERLVRRSLGRFGFPKLPRGAVPHLKYPVVVDGSAFREATGFEHELDEVTTMESFRWA